MNRSRVSNFPLFSLKILVASLSRGPKVLKIPRYLRRKMGGGFRGLWYSLPRPKGLRGTLLICRQVRLPY